MATRPRLRRRRRTKIIATLGPASSTPEIMARLFQAGADVFRLNFSHGTHPEHAARFAMIRQLEERFSRPIGILADVQGPKLRVGGFSAGRVFLQPGQRFQLDLNPTPGGASRVNLPHPEIIEAAHVGCSLLLDDGKLRLRVMHKRGDALEIRPCVPAAWASFTITYRYGESTYEVTVERPGTIRGETPDIELDGQRTADGTIPLIDDGRQHRIIVRPRQAAVASRSAR